MEIKLFVADEAVESLVFARVYNVTISVSKVEQADDFGLDPLLKRPLFLSPMLRCARRRRLLTALASSVRRVRRVAQSRIE